MRFLIALLLVAISVSTVAAQCPDPTVCPAASVRVRSYRAWTPEKRTVYVPRTYTVLKPTTVTVARVVQPVAWAPLRGYGSTGKAYGSVGGSAGKTAVVVVTGGSVGGSAGYGRTRGFIARVGYLAWTPARVLSGGSRGK